MANKKTSSSSSKEPASAAGDNPASEHEAGDPGAPPAVNEEGEVQDKAGTHYCPGCGRRFENPATCTGTATAPHQAIDTAPTSELKKAPEHHTAAPASE